MTDPSPGAAPAAPAQSAGRHAAPPSRRGRTIAAIVLGVLLVLVALLLLRACRSEEPAEIRVVAVGDMACDPTDPEYNDGRGTEDWCRQADVSDLAVSLEPDLFLGLGDYQYELPTTAGYDEVYGPTWGRLREITRPALGNQEYKVYQANTFRSYFGDYAGEERGYWSYDKGPWHFVVLNSNCTTVVGGCGEGSPQQQWLAEDLAAHEGMCTVAYWHHPRFSNGIMGPDQRTLALWKTLMGHRVAAVLSGHEADYERFPRLDEKGRNDLTGPRQFVVGTGGQIHYHPQVGDAPWRQKLTPVDSDYVNFDTHGVLQLTLKDGSYDWEYVSIDGEVLDSGSDTC